MAATKAVPNPPPTSFRPDEDLKLAICTYKEAHHLRSVSEAVCDLVIVGLRARQEEALAAKPKRALHHAMSLLFPDWSGVTSPDFGKPVKVTLKGGKDPISLILERRKA